MTSKTEEKKEDRLPVEVRAQMLQKETSLYFNLAKFEHAQRIASLFSSSTMVPKHFQGNVANCLIALNYADRLQADPFMVMQNMYIVHGRPGVEAKLVIALINQSGKYEEPLKYKFDGTGDEYGCTAWTREAKSGEIVEGPKITLTMVKNEGWNQDKKNKETGYVQKSKWNTMPEMMFRYRAASYFANVHCPELKLGMATVEEINDFVDLHQTTNGKFAPAVPVESADFNELFANEIADPQFSAYLQAAGETYKLSEDETRTEFAKQPEQIKRLFQEWKKRSVAAENVDITDKSATPISFREEWINLKGPGFSTFVFKHIDRFKALNGDYLSEAAAKWKKLYPTFECPFYSKPIDKNVREATGEAQGEEIDHQDDESTVDQEKVELEALRDEIRQHEKIHSGFVLQAKRETGIAHATTIDGCRMLLEKIESIIKGKNSD